MVHVRSIAVAQTTPRRGDVDSNVAEHLRLARAAAAERAQVLLFPELSLTGYELELADALAFNPDDARLAPLLDAAAEHDTTLVVGAPLRLDERLHIGALALAPDRSIALYTKRHLGAFAPGAHPGGSVPPDEATVFVPGAHDPLVAIGSEVAAFAVCADTGHASHVEAAARRGATCYLASMFVVPADLEADAARLAAYAGRHALLVAMANFGGPSGGLAAAGGSAIWTPAGELLARLRPTGSGLLCARRSGAGWRAEAVDLATR